MKKVTTVFGLLALMLIVTSFTTPSQIGGGKGSNGGGLGTGLAIGGGKGSDGGGLGTGGGLAIGGGKGSDGGGLGTGTGIY